MIAALILLAAAGADMPELNLSCVGEGLRPQMVETVLSGEANDGSKAEIKGQRTEQVSYKGEMGFRMRGGVAEMRPPVAIVGDAKWYPIKKLQVSDDEITGKVKTDIILSSAFRIDRRTGELTTEGGFKGACSPVTADRRF